MIPIDYTRYFYLLPGINREIYTGWDNILWPLYHEVYLDSMRLKPWLVYSV